MLTRNLGSSETRMSVALPLDDCRRHTKPGEDSASALMRSSAAMKSANSELPGGATARPTFNCAMCHVFIGSLSAIALEEPIGCTYVTASDYPPRTYEVLNVIAVQQQPSARR